MVCHGLKKSLAHSVLGGGAAGAASQCSPKNGGEDLSCQLRTLQSGLQESARQSLVFRHTFQILVQGDNFGLLNG